MPNYKFPGRFPINFRKFGNVTAFCVSLTCLTYVLVYGKVLDWYDDESIRWATAVSILFAGIFLYMDVTVALCLVGCIQTTYHPYGRFALSAADDHQFQCHVC